MKNNYRNIPSEKIIEETSIFSEDQLLEAEQYGFCRAIVDHPDENNWNTPYILSGDTLTPFNKLTWEPVTLWKFRDKFCVFNNYSVNTARTDFLSFSLAIKFAKELNDLYFETEKSYRAMKERYLAMDANPAEI